MIILCKYTEILELVNDVSNGHQFKFKEKSISIEGFSDSNMENNNANNKIAKNEHFRTSSETNL